MAYDVPVNAKWYHYLAIFPLYLIVRLWQATLSLDADEESKRQIGDPKKLIGLAWHDSIFFLPWAKRKLRAKSRMSGLVSASRDGSYLVAFFKFCRIGAVRGSSRGRSAASIIGLIDAVQNGSDIFITPDGPLGPAHRAKSGFFEIARQTNARILLIHVSPSRFKRLRTWDKFMLPLPFSKVKLSAFNFENYEVLLSASEAVGLTPAEYVAKYLSTGSF